MNLQNSRAELLAGLGAPSFDLDSGMFPAGSLLCFHNGEPVELDANLVPSAARSYLLKAAIAGLAQLTTWYGMPFAAFVDPTAALTAANFNATLTEFVNYTQAARPTWVQDAEAAQAIANAATLMSITIDVGAALSIAGFALVSTSVKGGTAGVLLAAMKFAAARTVQPGDVLQFQYTLQALAGP
jgi:hypothetical protein